jgi:multicomponent Na+:H+ antiporter subunit D
VHVTGGLFLLSGIIIHVANTGSIAFGLLQGNGLAFYLILIGFLLNAAVPPLHAWLPDAYPEATITGAVFLCAFTTKTAVYVLLRGFPGTELLVWLGAVMTIFGVVYAFLENDIRRILGYHIISQVGYMVAGAGIGTVLGTNGSAAHAYAHIIYKGLLFMATGAVVQMTGKSKLTELGGLYKTMPITFIMYMIAGVSISAFPLFSGFVSKSMVVSAAAEEHMAVIWLMLTLASSGTFLSVGIKLPYYAFFAKDSGIRAKEPPLNMLLGMGLAAFLCIFIGVYPPVLYNILPHHADYVPYTAEHVVGSLQILMFTGLAFFVLLHKIKGKAAINLDMDWFYRKGSQTFMRLLKEPKLQFGNKLEKIFLSSIPKSLSWFCQNPLAACKIALDTVLLNLQKNTDLGNQERKRINKEKEIYPGDLIKHWPIGSTVVWVTLFLLVYLLIFLTT